MDYFVMVIAIIISLIFGYYGSYWQIFKKKISQFATCLDKVDKALYDDTVTEKEFREIWEACKKVWGWS